MPGHEPRLLPCRLHHGNTPHYSPKIVEKTYQSPTSHHSPYFQRLSSPMPPVPSRTIRSSTPIWEQFWALSSGPPA